MAFIGIIADSNDEIVLKRELACKLNKKHTIITINNKNVENIKHIKFETILLMSTDAIKNNYKIINNILEKAEYLVINADIEDGLEFINNMKLNIISFGFNQKSTITISSVENNFMICVQREMLDIDKNVIEPQEIRIKLKGQKSKKNAHNLMGTTSILLIYGKNEIFF